MKISLILTCTNPTKLKYFTFFATVKSWYRHVDEIIIVDGGTYDGSFDKIKADELKKCKIISNPSTIWEISQGFTPNHINSMINEGLRHATGDWAFVIGADFVLDWCHRRNLDNELELLRSEYWVRFSRRKAKMYDTDKWFYEHDNRGTVAFNMSKIRKLDQFPYMMGLFKVTILYLITPY